MTDEIDPDRIGTRTVDPREYQHPLTRKDFAFFAEHRPRVTPLATLLTVRDCVETERRLAKLPPSFRPVFGRAAA